jgi:hypothetical protein
MEVLQTEKVMTYTDLPIHQRINAKNNATILYTMPGLISIIRRIHGKDSRRYSPGYLMLGPEVHREPKNAGNPKY